MRIESYCLSSKLDSAEAALAVPAVETLPGLDTQLPGLDVHSPRPRYASSLGPDERITNRILNSCRDFILGLKNVCKFTVPAISPDVAASFGFDELACDPQPVAASTHTAFQHVAYPQFAITCRGLREDK